MWTWVVAQRVDNLDDACLHALRQPREAAAGCGCHFHAILWVVSGGHVNRNATLPVPSLNDPDRIWQYPLKSWLLDSNSQKRAHDRDEDRAHLIANVNEWLWAGNVRPVLTWPESGPRLELRQDSTFANTGEATLFGALAEQIMLAVSRTDDLAFCAACAVPYIPKRRRRINQLNYCARCSPSDKPRAAWRDAQRRRRSKSAIAASNPAPNVGDRG
jgi:hypothetical protein